MKKRIAAVILSMVLGAGMLAGCGQKNTTDAGASSTTEVSADAEKADSAATDNKEEDADANVGAEWRHWQSDRGFPGNCDCDRWSGNGNHRLEQYPLRLHDRRRGKIFE